jgi:hypothetical protein
MRADGKSEVQHYVPQFLLRNFSFGKKGKGGKQEERYVYAFDKHTDKVFQPNIEGIASETGFYDFYVGEEDRSLEPALSDLESKTQIAIQKIVKEENLSSLLPKDRAWLSLFIAIQHLRVRKQREVIKKLSHDVAERMKKMGYDPDKVEGFKRLSDEETKQLTLGTFVKHAPIYAELIRGKICLLFKTPKSHPLYISDNPITMHNDEDFGPYGNIGFGVPSIQIYFPISSTLTLGFWCSSFQRKFEESWAEFERLAQQVKTSLHMSPYANREQLREMAALYAVEKQRHDNFLKNVTGGTPIEIPHETVTFMNSLQVKWSHRFVMCEKNDFDLVRRMISDNEIYREGVKITID